MATRVTGTRNPLATGLVLLIAVLAGLALFAATLWQRWSAPARPETVVASTLQAMHEQALLVPFTARYVAVVTSRQQRFGLAAQKTLILPGTVRYELDLAAVKPADLRWDEGTQTLRATLPPLRVAGPEFDLTAAREYSDGGVLIALTDAEATLDQANRAAARDDLLAQARAAVPLRLAREAAVRAVTQTLTLPLRAAGLDARVEVQLPATLAAGAAS